MQAVADQDIVDMLNESGFEAVASEIRLLDAEDVKVLYGVKDVEVFL